MEFGAAINAIEAKVQNWLTSLLEMLPNLIVAIFTIVLFIFVAKLIKRGTNNVFDRLSNNLAINRLISSIIYLIIVFIGIFVALGILQLDKTVTSLLAGAGIIGLAISFAFQDTFANFISGVIIATRKPFTIGDLIKSNDYFGTIHEMGLRTTRIKTPEGQLVIIPNKSVLSNPIINYTEFGTRRIDLEVGISYGEDLEKVKKVVLDAIGSIDYLIKNKEIEFFFTKFDSSSINFVVRYWIRFAKQPDYLKAKSDGIMNIKATFDKNGITIPFPIRTLDFGIKGGEKLENMWPDNFLEKK